MSKEKPKQEPEKAAEGSPEPQGGKAPKQEKPKETPKEEKPKEVSKEEKPKETPKEEKPKAEQKPEAKQEQKSAATAPPAEKKKKKINKMTLKEIDKKLQEINEKMGGMKSKYALELLKRKKELIG